MTNESQRIPILCLILVLPDPRDTHNSIQLRPSRSRRLEQEGSSLPGRVRPELCRGTSSTTHLHIFADVAISELPNGRHQMASSQISPRSRQVRPQVSPNLGREGPLRYMAGREIEEGAGLGEENISSGDVRPPEEVIGSEEQAHFGWREEEKGEIDREERARGSSR